MLGKDVVREYINAPDLSQKDAVFLILCCEADAPKSIAEIKKIGKEAGLREIEKWNIADILGKAKGLSCKIKGGWILTRKGIKYVSNLVGIKNQEGQEENNFLNQKFNLDLSLLNIDTQFEFIIKQRIEEIEKCLKISAPLSIIFLCGSILEGLLQDKASKNIQKFKASKSAPKDKDGKIKPIQDWTLDNLINVAHDVGLIELDIKKFSHDLRDFRNYIHPRQQALQNFHPDKHTAEISFKVLQATITSLSGQRK